ncbi:ARM repeat-containing protein [Venustampulla echinocandica]|uniref:ARM repeat-containing protein n=1 Tax=Venustampulla echinocandica TaxID=2656787 RepID=A0A370TNE8_9HELO|nr:ARM repeat-containing protein [Venustampulla echinocandica]RDL37038.1 ARM repeat-containing protein [Venustampulla echinocandica]
MGEPPLADRLLQTGKLAFDPDQPEEVRQENRPRFKAIIDGTSTLVLMPVLNLLIQPGRTHPWLRAPLISALASLPLRPRGVQDTIEFILSVHPSSRVGSSEDTSKQAGISYEALNAASRLLCSPPFGMASERWFSGIAPQLLSLLQGQGEPGMDKAAAFIIGFGILGRKQYGAPGMAGWKAFAAPMLSCIDPTITPESTQAAASEEDIITLGAPKILVSSGDVSRSLCNLLTLVTSHPNPGLARRLLKPILLPLWSLASWYDDASIVEITFCKPAREMLKILVQLSPVNEEPVYENCPRPTSYCLSTILDNLLFKGRSGPGKPCWEYASSKDGGIQVQQPDNNPQKDTDIVSNLARIDHGVDKFIAFLGILGSTPDFVTEVSRLFMSLCSKWLSNNDRQIGNPVLSRLEASEDRGDIESRLIEARVMQKLMDTFPDKLISDSKQVLALVCQVLSDFTDASGDHTNSDDAVAVALSLLNMLLTTPSFQISLEDTALDSIQSSLKSISRLGREEISPTAKSLQSLLRFHSTIGGPQVAIPSTSTDQQWEDRKSYSLAMSYLMASDSPPPVRVQGLEILSTLMRANSAVLDIPALLILFTSILQDKEEYIYLRAIQSLIQLSQRHPKAVMKDLIDRYVDPDEEYELDQRLRLGEALLQVIQTSALQFTGETARSVCHGLLFISSRRGYRPKTERAQERRLKSKKKSETEAEEAWGGEVPQLAEDEMSPEDEILAQIVSGWESKRGTEDVRIRASALSILGSVLESNLGGIDPSTTSAAIDMSIHILTLEPELQRAILRRAAILLIMDFIRALEAARSEGRSLGFGFVGQSLDNVTRVLEYVKDTDSDGLVRQHAKDVVESLQAWQMNSLFASRAEPQTEIQELSGLHIRPGGGSRESRMTPRIEEIE